MAEDGKAGTRLKLGVGEFRFDSQLNFKRQVMKRNVLFCIFLTLAGSMIAAETGPKDDVADAAKKLADAGNYAWKTTVEFGNFTGETQGKADKEGLISLSMSFGDNTTEAFLKNGKGAVKSPDQDWQSLTELENASDQGPRRFLLRRLQTFKAPAVELKDLAEKTKELKKDGDVYSGALSDAGAKELLSFGRRGGNASEPKNAKGSVKIWMKSGMISKYVVNVQGQVSFNGEERDVDRTSTTEIKDVGATRVEAPEPAKKKLT